MPDDLSAWQISKTRHIWILHAIKNAMSEQEPRLLRPCEIFKENGKISDTTNWRALKFVEKHRFIKKVRVGDTHFYLLTPKGEDLIFAEDKTIAFNGILAMVYEALGREG